MIILAQINGTDNFTKLLPPLVDGFTSNLLAYAGLLAAISTIVMTLLELVKAMARMRLTYQKRMVKQWLRENSDAFDQLIVLSIADRSLASALFDQPSEKMMGQIQAAANVALDAPNSYPDLYAFLTKTSPVKASIAASPDVDAATWKKFNQDYIATTGQQAPQDVVQAATQARSRLDHFVTRKLDALQTKIDYMWARLNQTVSIAGSAAFIFVILLKVNNGVAGAGIFVTSIFGGMIAPFAKDVVTALSNVKAGK